jgi:cytochrome c oxidase subunit IV
MVYALGFVLKTATLPLINDYFLLEGFFVWTQQSAPFATRVTAV